MGDAVVKKLGDLLYEVGPGTPATDGSPSTGPTYRNVYAANGYPTLEGVRSLYDVFQKSARDFGAKPCLGVREGSAYTWETYQVDSVDGIERPVTYDCNSLSRLQMEDMAR